MQDSDKQDPRLFISRMCDAEEVAATQQLFAGLDPNTSLDGMPLLHHLIRECEDDTVEVAVKIMLHVSILCWAMHQLYPTAYQL